MQPRYDTIFLQLGNKEFEVEVRYTYEPAERGCITGSHDTAVEPQDDQWEIIDLTDAKTGKPIVHEDDQGHLIDMLQGQIIEKLKELGDE